MDPPLWGTWSSDCYRVSMCVFAVITLSSRLGHQPSAITSPCYQAEQGDLSMILLFMIWNVCSPNSNKIGVGGVGLPWTAWATHESCCCFLEMLRLFISFCIRIQHWSKLLAPNQLLSLATGGTCPSLPPSDMCLILSIEGHFGRGCLILGRDLQILQTYKLAKF